MEKLDITILCKVVDNFGDIGVVYRLAKNLSESCLKKKIPLKLRIIVDNLHAFSLLCPEINEKLNYQTIKNWQIFNWNEDSLCFSEFSKNQPFIILECFQCGRPEWLENLLFTVKVPEIVNIIMLDYLTAEDYAETFHKLQSLTRSSRVQKVNFMPGFTKKTGGLLFDKNCLKLLQGGACPSLQNTTTDGGRVFPLPPLTGDTPVTPPNKNIIFFSYPRELIPITEAFCDYQKITNKKLTVKLAQGAGNQSFLDAFSKISNKENCFNLQNLHFLSQENWDNLLFESDILFIRGEESLSRACLYAKPFIWHAYPQSEDYQLVKVRALLSKMQNHFPPKLFSVVENLMLIYNGENSQISLQKATLDFLLNYESLIPCYKNFSLSLLQNGDLAENIIEFIKVIGKKE